MSETAQTILVVVIVLLAVAELTVIILGVTILLKVRSIVKEAKQLVHDGHSVLDELSDRVRSRRSLIATTAWLLKQYKRRKSHG